jgi:hypothetical protein
MLLQCFGFVLPRHFSFTPFILPAQVNENICVCSFWWDVFLPSFILFFVRALFFFFVLIFSVSFLCHAVQLFQIVLITLIASDAHRKINVHGAHLKISALQFLTLFPRTVAAWCLNHRAPTISYLKM